MLEADRRPVAGPAVAFEGGDHPITGRRAVSGPARAFAASFLLAASLLLTACGEGEAEGGAKAGGAAAPPPPEVTVATPLVRKLTEWDEFTGRFEPVQRVEIRARVTGYIQDIRFEDGQVVEKDQVLFVIDPRPYQAAVDRYKAQVGQAQAQLELSKLEQDRTQRLVSTSAAAKATLDQRNAELLGAEAALASAKAQLRDNELNLAFTQVKAPFKGRISDRRADVGNLVSDATLLTTLVQLDPAYLVFDMSESDFLAYQRAVAEGKLPSTRDRATVVYARLVDEQDWTLQGAMNFVDNVVDEGSGTVRGRATFPNANGLITPGQFGRIRVPGSPEYDAILVPEAAIVTDQSRKQLMVLGPDNKIEPRVIRPGPSQPGGLRIMRSGIKPEDKFVIGGLMRARPGTAVQPKEGKVEVEPAPEPAS
jgi:RND family efflux transporter MFP subunit